MHVGSINIGGGQWQSIIRSNGSIASLTIKKTFFSVYFKLTTKSEFFFSDSNISFSILPKNLNSAEGEIPTV